MGSIFVLLGSINQLIDGFNITAWIFYCLVFIAAIIMRFTKRKEKRPFKVPHTHTHTHTHNDYHTLLSTRGYQLIIKTIDGFMLKTSFEFKIEVV